MGMNTHKKDSLFYMYFEMNCNWNPAVSTRYLLAIIESNKNGDAAKSNCSINRNPLAASELKQKVIIRIPDLKNTLHFFVNHVLQTIDIFFVFSGNKNAILIIHFRHPRTFQFV